MYRLLFVVALLIFSSGATVAQDVESRSGQTPSQQIELVWGSTDVNLSSGFLGALGSLSIAPSTIFPSSLRGTRLSFPITDGSLERRTLRGEIVHNGGLRLTKGSTKVKLKSFIIDTTGSGIVLTGLVSANGTVVGRIPLFDLRLPVSSSATHFGLDRVSLNGVAVTLRPEAAAALNAVFSTNAFAAGFGIGTANVRGFGYID